MENMYPGANESWSPERRRLMAVAHLLNRDPVEEPAAYVARQYGLSTQWLYELTRRAEAALVPRPAGPPLGARLLGELRETIEHHREHVSALEAENRHLRSELAVAVKVDATRMDQVELVCFANGVPLRGTQEILGVAFGAAWRPRLEDVQQRRKAHGTAARALLSRVENEVAPELLCVAGDEVYFHGQPVKLIVEPVSVAVLGIGREGGASAEDWARFLKPYTHLELFVSDLGGGLLAAAAERGIPHQADYFHEKRWLNDNLLAPIAAVADRAWKALREAIDRASRPNGLGPWLSAAAVRQAEADSAQADAWFFAACAVVETVDTLFGATDPSTGHLWPASHASTALQGAIASLSTIPLPAARKAAKHLGTYGHRFSAWRHLFDTIKVRIRPGTGATSRGVLNDILTLRKLRRQLQGWGRDTADVQTLLVDVQRRIARFERHLRHCCENLDEVANTLRHFLTWPSRSSSMVESLNSRLRVLQTTHRNVTDEMLALKALAWNLSPRRHAGKRGHASPYQMLGVNLGPVEQPWYDVLLQAEAKAA